MATDSPPASRPKSSKDADHVPFFVARNWQGMTLSVWLRTLTKHRFAIAPSRIKLALRISLFALANSGLGWWERFLYGDVIRSARIDKPPLFVIGHWRTGTTWLHELLAQDEQFTYPTTYQCMAPHHFYATRDYTPAIMPYLLPAQRPMDNMIVGWDRPQEDEFALCNLGAPSPYLSWAFPNEPRQYEEFLTLRYVSRREKRQWQKTILGFLRHIAAMDPRRIVLKSPTHTARIAALLEIFPEAQFIHIVRDPYVVFPSTIKTWKRLWNMMGLQVPSFTDVEEYTFATFVKMHRTYQEDRKLLHDNQLCEVRYEDLRGDLLGEMRRIYEELDLGDFTRVEPELARYVKETSAYKTNKFDVPDDLRNQIAERWREYIQQYGY